MVEINEMAIIYKRSKNNDGMEFFTPFRVVEGYYNEEDNMFIDKDGYTYHHITALMCDGNCYGDRIKIGHAITQKRSKSYSDIKREYLDKAREYSYYRNFIDTYFVYKEKYETKQKRKFMDIDSLEGYEEYQSSAKKYDSDFHEENRGKEVMTQTSQIALPSQDVVASLPNHDLTPKEIADRVKESIRGQDAAVETIATTIWRNKRFIGKGKNNMLVVGPTGTGKTAIFQALSKILDIPLIVFSVPGLTQSGYVGRDTNEILLQLYLECQKNIEKGEKGIVILDEIDKIAGGRGDGGFIATEAVQNELLKLLEGDKRMISESHNSPKVLFDSSNITFIGSGAFSELFEKEKATIGFSQPATTEKKLNSELLCSYGIKREMVGRLPIIVQLNQLTRENLIDIILNVKDGEYSKAEAMLRELGITHINSSTLAGIIADDAIEKGIGARGLEATIAKLFDKIFYQIGNNIGVYDSLIIGDNILEDPLDFKLSRQQDTVSHKKRCLEKN